MKKTPYILLLSTLLFLLGSCGEDRWPAYYEYTADNLWMDSLMRKYYLWEEDMPAFKELTSQYFATNDAFLSEVKNEDDEITSVDSLDTFKPGYGMDYRLLKLSDEEDIYAALVTYVEPNSPAGKAGIERGTWIMQVDGNGLTSENSSTFLSDGKDHLLTMGLYNEEIDEEGNRTIYIISYAYAPLGAKEIYEREDVPYSNVLKKGNITVGYLLCNRFTGETSELISLSNEFASEGVNEVVLDLRYNTNSTLDGMALLASILAPSSALGKTLATMKYNSKNHPEWPASYTLNTPSGGSNLNLTTLYVLTSSKTKGIAEHLINCLKPYMNVVIIGGTTMGESYATQVFDNETFGLQFRLVTAVVSDADGVEANFSGFSPDVSASETSDLTKVLPFGDAGEALLSVALKKMTE